MCFYPFCDGKKPWISSPAASCLWCWISSYTQCYQWTKTRIPCSVQMLVMGNLLYCCGSEQQLAGFRHQEEAKIIHHCLLYSNSYTFQSWCSPCKGEKKPQGYLKQQKPEASDPLTCITVHPTMRSMSAWLQQRDSVPYVYSWPDCSSRIFLNRDQVENDSFSPRARKSWLNASSLNPFSILNCREEPDLNEIF